MNYRIFILAAALALMSSCVKEKLVSEPSGEITEKTSANVVEDKIVLKVSKDLADRISRAGSGLRTKSGDEKIDGILGKYGLTRFEPVFIENPKYSKRFRESGLNQWFTAVVEPKTKAVAADELKYADGIEYVGDSHIIKLNGRSEPISYVDLSAKGKASTKAEGGTFPFNDLGLPKQWHYNNEGTLEGSKVGADINVFQAWDKSNGTPDVIVCVVDGGIQYDHVDLHQNMFVNEAEKNGQEGVDDDNNGYVDDIYGYNFVDKKGELVAHNHGTHVAGTVAAMNNNVEGVCGVAGGDGSKESGIRMISAQIFRHNGPGQPDSGTDEVGVARAIQYGADMGAVISQNSWGYTDAQTTPEPLVAAIDYFIQYAGCDDEGNQRPDSPMKGGVVIFAAGNDGVEKFDYPSSLPQVISVAAIAPNFKMAFYSTHGTWVDISAPGGDSEMIQGKNLRSHQVLSTFPNNKYGYLDGTSMACPHVSGIAALIASKFKGQGFTNEQLKEKLLGSANDIYLENPEYYGKLGRGLVDANKALTINMNKFPDRISDLELTNTTSRFSLSWTTVRDEDDEFATWYYVYASKTRFPENYDFLNPGADVLVQKIRARRGRLEKMEGTSALLEVGSKYYVAAVAEDQWGNRSEVSDILEGTVLNGLPLIREPEKAKPVRITGTETGDYLFLFNDPDLDGMTVSLEGNENGNLGIQRKGEENKVIVTIGTGDLKAGEYSATLVVTDSHGGVARQNFKYTVYDNSAPVEAVNMDYLTVGIGEESKVYLGKYFKDPDNHELSYELIDAGDSHTAVSSVDKSYLSITALKRGISKLRLRVSDTQKGVFEKEITVVVSNSKLLSNMVVSKDRRTLELTMNPNLRGLVRFMVFDAYGTKLLRRIVQLSGSGEVSLDISSLVPSSYTLVVENSETSEKVEFVK